MQLDFQVFKNKNLSYSGEHYLKRVLTYTLVLGLYNNHCGSVTECNVDSS